MAPAAGRIRDRSTFRALRRPAGRATRGLVRVSYVAPRDSDRERFARVGYAIDRRCGNAVARNRLRRRCREAARQASAEVPAGSYLVRPEPGALTLDYADLARAVREAMIAAAAGRAADR